jgi:hypothetical protein
VRMGAPCLGPRPRGAACVPPLGGHRLQQVASHLVIAVVMWMTVMEAQGTKVQHLPNHLDPAMQQVPVMAEVTWQQIGKVSHKPQGGVRGAGQLQLGTSMGLQVQVIQGWHPAGAATAHAGSRSQTCQQEPPAAAAAMRSQFTVGHGVCQYPAKGWHAGGGGRVTEPQQEEIGLGQQLQMMRPWKPLQALPRHLCLHLLLVAA